MGIHFYTKLSCNLLDLNFERASTLNGLALSISHVIDKLEVSIYFFLRYLGSIPTTYATIAAILISIAPNIGIIIKPEFSPSNKGNPINIIKIPYTHHNMPKARL